MDPTDDFDFPELGAPRGKTPPTLEASSRPDGSDPRLLLKKKGDKLPKWDPYGNSFGRADQAFQLGTVISFPFVGLTYINPPDPKNLTREDTLTHMGQWIHSKIRKYVVIERYHFHCIVVPIFTYGNNGISGRAKAQKKEYLGIRDEAELNTQPRNLGDSPHGLIFARRAQEYAKAASKDWHYISPNAYIHVRAPLSFNYDWPCKIEGFVEDEMGRRHLQSLYYGPCRQQHMPMDQYAAAPQNRNGMGLGTGQPRLNARVTTFNPSVAVFNPEVTAFVMPTQAAAAPPVLSWQQLEASQDPATREEIPPASPTPPPAFDDPNVTPPGTRPPTPPPSNSKDAPKPPLAPVKPAVPLSFGQAGSKSTTTTPTSATAPKPPWKPAGESSSKDAGAGPSK